MYKILLVDDEAKIREVIREYAEFSGYEVTEAEDGMSAIGLCKLNDYDIIIMDVMMPKLDGFSACKEIKKIKDIPVIMLSARGEEYDKLFGFELGIDDYIVKPFSPKELMARINAVLARVTAQTSTPQGILTFGGLEINIPARTVTVDGEKVAGVSITNDKVMKLLKGPKDTKVTLGIKRNNSKTPITFEITRGEIPVNSVIASYIIAPEIGYIKVDKFGEKTYNEFSAALNELTNKGASKFIIDLRGNGGGTMSAALLMANEFLPSKCKIVATKFRDSEDKSLSDGLGKYPNAEVTVIIDEFSASASEIFAGALQDNDRGLIVGRR